MSQNCKGIERWPQSSSNCNRINENTSKLADQGLHYCTNSKTIAGITCKRRRCRSEWIYAVNAEVSSINELCVVCFLFISLFFFTSPHRFQVCHGFGTGWHRDMSAGNNMFRNTLDIMAGRALHPNFYRTVRAPPRLHNLKLTVCFSRLFLSFTVTTNRQRRRQQPTPEQLPQ